MPYSYYHTIILPVRRNIQDTRYDCGPASLKIILETLQLSVDEESLMKICKTTPEFSTKPAALSDALKKMNVKHKIYEHANVKLMQEKIRELNLCIINYQAWGRCGEDFRNLESGHYSVIFGFNKEHLFVADPFKNHTEKYSEWGFHTIDKKLLCGRWNDKIMPEETITRHWMMTVPLTQNIVRYLRKQIRIDICSLL